MFLNLKNKISVIIIHIGYKDYLKYAGSKGAKENGKTRQEGKEYLVKDGDIIHFLFNV